MHAPVPDHNAVVTVFQLDKENRGEGYWKLNVSVFDEEAYQAGIRHLIKDTAEEYEGSKKLMVWVLIKMRIREYSILSCTHRNTKKNIHLNGLEFKLNRLKLLLQNDIHITDELLQPRK
jgi:hypothetical protein